jgi:hypothetical protein
MFSIEALARAYRVDVIDYKRDGDGVLIASGSGSMMSTMDVCPRFRWCLDIDQQPRDCRLADWIAFLPRVSTLVGVVGWFSITDPGPLRAALEPIAASVHVYVPDVDLPGNKYASLEAFIAGVN